MRSQSFTETVLLISRSMLLTVNVLPGLVFGQWGGHQCQCSGVLIQEQSMLQRSCGADSMHMLLTVAVLSGLARQVKAKH